MRSDRIGAYRASIDHIPDYKDTSFPRGLVRIIVPFPPGGGTDVLGRLLSSEFQTLWGQSVILDNRPGAAGLIGTRQAAAAPAPSAMT